MGGSDLSGIVNPPLALDEETQRALCTQKATVKQMEKGTEPRTKSRKHAKWESEKTRQDFEERKERLIREVGQFSMGQALRRDRMKREKEILSSIVK